MTTQVLSKERLAKMHAETMEVIDSKPRATDTASIEVNAKLFATMCGALLAAHEQVPVARVVSKFGDPEAFGERELKVLVDIQKLPYNTPLYTHPAPSILAAVPEPVSQPYKLPEKVSELISGVRTINRSPQHVAKVMGDTAPCYWQRKEWIDWILSLCDEVEQGAKP